MWHCEGIEISALQQQQRDRGKQHRLFDKGSRLVPTSIMYKHGASPTSGCFRKWWYPQIIHFNRVFHYKPSFLGYHYFWKHPSRNLTCLLFLWSCHFSHLKANVKQSGAMTTEKRLITISPCYPGIQMMQKKLPSISPIFLYIPCQW